MSLFRNFFAEPNHRSTLHKREKETTATMKQRKEKVEPLNRHAKSGQRTRILLLDNDRIKPNSEAWHFLRRLVGKCGRTCIELVQQADDKPRFRIAEDACPICMNSAKQCPGNAVRIVNLPTDLSSGTTTHCYGPNAFRLHGLPMPRPGHVLGIVGGNGIGKSTALKILSGSIKPNLGAMTDGACSPSWQEIVRYYRGSDLQNYFQRLVEGNLSCATKPQTGRSFLRQYSGRKVRDVLSVANHQSDRLGAMVQKLELTRSLDREVQTLSGGERQRLAVCLCTISDADVYFFDEPTSFLDVKQRLIVAEIIRDIVDNAKGSPNKYVIVVEHDLTILDYVSDQVCCLYGEPGAFGVVSQRYTTANGINNFVAGYLSSENVRFRAEPLSFQAPGTDEEQPRMDNSLVECRYPAMTKTHGGEGSGSSFTLHIEAGGFRNGEIVGLLGQNAVGKTTFVEMVLSHVANCDQLHPSPPVDAARMAVSYKRQHLPQFFGEFRGTVEEFLNKYMQWGQTNRVFSAMVKKPLRIDRISNLLVRSLSTGELQRLAICLCLGTPAQLYLIDEPSAFLDSEQRLVVAKVIRRWVVSHLNMPAFVVEHDMVMASAMYDRVIVYTGVPGVECTAAAPTAPTKGMNAFLQEMDVTMYRSLYSKRPRINKRGSRRDREQKASGNFFAID